jgi:hypothetical protein
MGVVFHTYTFYTSLEKRQITLANGIINLSGSFVATLLRMTNIPLVSRLSSLL